MNFDICGHHRKKLMVIFCNSSIRSQETHKSRNLFTKDFVDLFHKEYLQKKLINNEQCKCVKKCIDLLAKILSNYEPLSDRFQLINQTIMQSSLIESKIYRFVSVYCLFINL